MGKLNQAKIREFLQAKQKQGYSYTKMAFFCGVSYSYFQKFLRGQEVGESVITKIYRLCKDLNNNNEIEGVYEDDEI